MKKKKLILLIVAVSVVATSLHFLLHAAEPTEPVFQTEELASIRWDGRDNTRLIRANGKVEKLKAVFDRFPRPEGMDERAYYLTLAMNALAREGFQFAGSVSPDHIIMKRVVAR